MTTYVNIDERYGDAVIVTLEDYRELNPDGNFTQTHNGIYENGVQIAKVAQIQSYGAEYEIEIYNVDDEDMTVISAALQAANIDGDDRDEIGMYLRVGKGRAVFVDPSEVGNAVEIINSLGFETDEDGNEDSEF